jgi:sugar O-acyltransferase (sialic acid O-acetyltransferase NeuD family)
MAVDLILVGGGGHCRSCIDVIELCGEFRIAGIVDNELPKFQTVMGYPVIGADDDLAYLKAQGISHALITVGQIKSPEIRIKLFDQLITLGFTLPTIISPLAHVSRSASLQGGTIVMHQALVNTCVQVGVNCIINSKALIEHDSVVGDHCHISTGAAVNGSCRVGRCCFLGSHSTLANDCCIKDNSFVRAHSLVVRQRI